ncbi:MAG TPA: DoxX family protein [Vicinamibacterales bacterium]|nr:DoxX family protein [Vicinamibacterales bacterium]
MQTIRKNVDLGLLLIRLALGIVFVMHGWQKLTLMGFDGFAGVLASLGVPFPALNSAIVITVELVGGLAMLAGIVVRPVGLLIAFTMIVAAATVHLRNGFFLPAGYEFTLVLMLASLAVSVAGAGAYSLDAWLFRSKPARVDAVRERLAA